MQDGMCPPLGDCDTEADGSPLLYPLSDTSPGAFFSLVR